MSNLKVVRATENINQDTRKYDVSDKLWLLDADIAVLAFFARKLAKKSVIDPEFRWFEKSSPARYSAANYSTGYTSAETSVVVDDGTVYRTGMVVQNLSTGEQMYVSGVSSNTLTLVRGWGTTSADAIANDAVLAIVGNANAEGAATPASLTSLPVKKTNYCQIFRESIEVTNTEKSTELYAGGSDLNQLRKEHLDLHMKDIERAFLFGEPKEDVSIVGTNGPMRSTGGAKYFISTNVSDVSTTTGILTNAIFETWVRGVFAKGGQKKMALVSPLLASAINSWAAGKLVMYPKDKTFGIAITQYLSIHGALDFTIERLFAENSTWGGMGFAFDMANLGYRYLAANGENRDTKLLKDQQAKGYDKTVDEYLSEIGLFLADEASHGLIKGITSYT